MKTTLDIDEQALAATREYAAAQGISIDQAVSILTSVGVEAEADPVMRARRRGFPMMKPRPGHVVTHGMVEKALDEIDY